MPSELGMAVGEKAAIEQEMEGHNACDRDSSKLQPPCGLQMRTKKKTRTHWGQVIL